MKILVCVKQVPASENIGSADMTRQDDFRMNRFDECAVEEALLIREAFGNVPVDVITVGPERCAEVLKRAVGMGADRGIHILAPDEPFQDPFVTASLIAGYVENSGYDLILSGVMSEDLMQGQVGPMTAELLSLPCATAVISARVLPESGTVCAERETEGGGREVLEIRLPALLSLQTGINTPRYPVLSHLLRAARQRPETIEAGLSGLPPDRQTVVSTAVPEKQRQGTVLEGSPLEKAEALLNIFQEKGFIR